MRLRGLATLAAIATSVLAVGPLAVPAGAHAYLESSTPANGQSLAVPPAGIELHFTEHVVLEATRVEVTGADGRQVAVRDLRLEESDEDREAPSSVVADLPALEHGAYHVAWHTLSSDDLHESSGVLAFGVGSSVSAAGPSEDGPDLFETLGRWVVLAGIGLVLGAGLVRWRLLGGLPDDAVRGRLRAAHGVLASRAAAAAATVAAAVAAVEVLRFGTAAFTGAYAARWALREGALLVAAWSASAAPSRRGRLAALVAVNSAGAAGILTVLLGHSGRDGGATWIIAASAHLLGALAWCGSVGLLAWLLVSAPRWGLGRRDALGVLRGFRGPAIAAVGVVAASGLYLASDVVVSVDAALVTSYGRILLLKLALAAVVGLIALLTSRAVHARGSALPRRRVVTEAMGLALVVGLGALLASGQPAIAPGLVRGGEPSTIDSRPVADLQQTLSIGPNRPGTGVALVDVLDTRRPSPGPVTGVSVAVQGGQGGRVGQSGPQALGTGARSARQVSGSQWAASVELPEAGDTVVTVVIHRRGLPDVSSTVPWVVGPRSGDATVVSRAPVAAPLRWSAGGLLLVLFVSGVVVVRRRAGSPSKSGGRRPTATRALPLPVHGRRAAPASRRLRAVPDPEVRAVDGDGDEVVLARRAGS